MTAIESINKFFVERHINLKHDWLQNAIEYARAKTGSDDVSPTVIYELWKYSDIKESTKPCITESIKNAKEFNDIMVLQIQAVTDIGVSYLSQFKKLVYVATDNAEFQSSDTPEQAEKECGSRLLQLLLSDGVTQIKAVEYKRVEQFSLLVCPGSKVIIHGNVRIRRDVFLLKPENCQLLGGDVEALMRTNRPVEIMAAKLCVPVPQKPEPQLQLTASTTTTNAALLPKDDQQYVSIPQNAQKAQQPVLQTTLESRIATATAARDAAANQQQQRVSIPQRPMQQLQLTDMRHSTTPTVNDAKSSLIPQKLQQNRYLPQPQSTTTTISGVTPAKCARLELATVENSPPHPSFSQLEEAPATPPMRGTRTRAPVPQPKSQQQQPPLPPVHQLDDTPPAKDSEALFGEYVASLLRSMSSEKRSQVRSKIFAVLNSD